MEYRRRRWLVQQLSSGEDKRVVNSTLETIIGRAYILHEKTGRPTMVIEDGHVVVDFNETLLRALPTRCHHAGACA